MARNSAARKVARASAAGRSSKVRGQLPLGFYSIVALILVLGTFLVGFSRYQFQHPKVVHSTPPTIGDHWNVAIGFDVCGRFLPDLPPQPVSSNVGIFTPGKGLVSVSPKSTKEEGNNATLGRFVSGYKGLEITASKLVYPGRGSFSSTSQCGGKPAQYGVFVWNSLLTVSPTKIADPSMLRFVNDQLITVAVVAKGSTIPKPPSLTALINAAATATTTTTLPPVPLAPSTTLVTGGSSTTAGKATTSTG